MACAALLAPQGTLALGEVGLGITDVTPISASGAAGMTAGLTGTIHTLDGPYQILVGKTVVANGFADGNSVAVNFTVPELPAATYSLTLSDVNTNVNTSKQFTVETGYSATASPSTAQEGSNVTINVAVTGSRLGTSYGADVAVSLPNGATYRAVVNLGTPNVKGTASKQIVFPSESFSPAGATTDYAGTYRISFNQTVATSQFNVNILDSTTYHRGQTATIRATGYQPNQAATITIISVKTGAVVDTLSATASADGVINAKWVIPSTIPIGDCTVKITTDSSPKAAKDQQTFTVVGYAVRIGVTNLAGNPVRGVNVRVLDSGTNTRSNASSDINGLAQFMLEKGVHSVTAFWNDVNVAQTNITVNGDGNFTLRCQLTDMKITVKTADGITISFVNLDINYRYQSGTQSRSGSASGQTDPSGSYTLASTLAGATYTIDASIYNRVFNTLNNTASNLPNQATSEVTIICPSKNVTLNVVDYNNEPISNARVELVELSNGLFYSATTDGSGAAFVQPTFGRYRLRIYEENALLKETNLQVFDNSDQQIRCTLYGIQLSVSVVDFFGAPIPNANVTLNGPVKASAYTQGNGVATFDNIIGGNMQIIAQAQGMQEASQALTTDVNESTTVQIKMDKYISLGGLLLQASTFITIIVVVVITLLFVIVEVNRRRTAKPAAKAAN